jgi:signal transduction protein with GAF and PtsI domain
MGLDPESVGKVSMAIGEGLTGLVIERMKPITVVDAPAHPRYKYFPETHEEHFHSFLGVPLIENKTPLGVLVVQTSRRREFSRDEIRLLTTISTQAASVIVQARLLTPENEGGRAKRIPKAHECSDAQAAFLRVSGVKGGEGPFKVARSIDRTGGVPRLRPRESLRLGTPHGS